MGWWMQLLPSLPAEGCGTASQSNAEGRRSLQQLWLVARGSSLGVHPSSCRQGYQWAVATALLLKRGRDKKRAVRGREGAVKEPQNL